MCVRACVSSRDGIPDILYPDIVWVYDICLYRYVLYDLGYRLATKFFYHHKPRLPFSLLIFSSSLHCCFFNFVLLLVVCRSHVIVAATAATATAAVFCI